MIHHPHLIFSVQIKPRASGSSGMIKRGNNSERKKGTGTVTVTSAIAQIMGVSFLVFSRSTVNVPHIHTCEIAMIA
jgi:hypothetical protein